MQHYVDGMPIASPLDALKVRARKARTERRLEPEKEEVHVDVKMEPRDPLQGWKRMVLLAMLIGRSVESELLLIEIIEEAKDKRDAALRKEKQLLTQPAQGLVTRGEIVQRQPLSRGTGQSLGHAMDECPHDLTWLVARGGKTHWWTCQGCNKRWPRSGDEVLAVLNDSGVKEVLKARMRVKSEKLLMKPDGYEAEVGRGERMAMAVPTPGAASGSSEGSLDSSGFAVLNPRQQRRA